MFVPSRKRWAYLPRTPSLKSYSGRRSSSESEGLLVFFIGLALTARGRSGVDNANLITPFRMRNYHKATEVRGRFVSIPNEAQHLANVGGGAEQRIVALGVGAEGALHARAPRRRTRRRGAGPGRPTSPVAGFGGPPRGGAPSPDPPPHAPGCAEVPKHKS